MKDDKKPDSSPTMRLAMLEEGVSLDKVDKVIKRYDRKKARRESFKAFFDKWVTDQKKAFFGLITAIGSLVFGLVLDRFTNIFTALFDLLF